MPKNQCALHAPCKSVLKHTAFSFNCSSFLELIHVGLGSSNMITAGFYRLNALPVANKHWFQLGKSPAGLIFLIQRLNPRRKASLPLCQLVNASTQSPLYIHMRWETLGKSRVNGSLTLPLDTMSKRSTLTCIQSGCHFNPLHSLRMTASSLLKADFSSHTKAMYEEYSVHRLLVNPVGEGDLLLISNWVRCTFRRCLRCATHRS